MDIEEYREKHWTWKILLLDVSEFAGGAVIALLIFAALFFILNYFNIISLSSVYSPLSLLPRQQTQTNLKTNSALQKPLPSPTPTPELSAKEILANFLPKIVNATLTPLKSELMLAQDKTTKENFTASWEKKEGTISAVLTLAKNSKQISSVNLQFLTAQISSPSVQLAQAIIPSFFSIQPKGIWGCKPLYDKIYCENFWEEKDGIRRGISVYGQFPAQDKTADSIINFCQHGKDAATIYAWKSCTTEFAKTGVH